MQNRSGFTLIEILIVIIILGITSTIAVLNFGNFGKDRKILLATERFENIIKLAQQQAILESATLGINIKGSRYQILRFQNKIWIPLSNKGIFKEHYFPQGTIIILTTKNKQQRNMPNIIIYPTGDMTPFGLSISNQNRQIIKTLRAHHNGELTFTTPKQP